MRMIHDRFFLSDYCGVELGAGFDCSNNNDKLHVSRVSYEDLSQIKEQLNKGKTHLVIN